jgi:hypothetical protein
VSDDFGGERADPGEDAAEAERGTRPGTPLWVKVFGAVALAVVLVFVVLLVLGSGHGPGRHGAPGDQNWTPSSNFVGAQPQP